MPDLPATDLRTNIATLAIANDRLPAVAALLIQTLPAEPFDSNFAGQYLQTTYFDTRTFALRKARLKKMKYFTLRIRCYAKPTQPGGSYPDGVYAISAKTEDGKFRTMITSEVAEFFLRYGITRPVSQLNDILPGDLLARLLDIADNSPLIPAVTVCFTRYAREDAVNRVTLDTNILTNTGKVFPTNILEQKTTSAPPQIMPELAALPYAPVRLSKFLWATTYGVR